MLVSANEKQYSTYHRWVKWMAKLSTIGPDRLMLISDQPMRELLVRSTVSVRPRYGKKQRAFLILKQLHNLEIKTKEKRKGGYNTEERKGKDARLLFSHFSTSSKS